MTYSPLHPHPGSAPHGPPEDLYRTPPPWEIGRPQPAFLALADTGAIRGRVLDVGCGTGELVLVCAGLGLDTTGIDIVPRALRIAEDKACDRQLTARFLHQDALRLADLGESFDTVLDSLVFHIWDDGDRAVYVDNLRSVVRPGGRLFMLCFSDAQPGVGNWGPRRVSRAEIIAAFADGWTVDSIQPTTIDSTMEPGSIKGWLVTLARI
jgi:SAM-dependent methyltransferase